MRNFDLLLRLRRANLYCCQGQSTLPGGISGLVLPRNFHGRTASCHALIYSGGSSQTSASALSAARRKRLGPPSRIQAGFLMTSPSIRSVSERGRCCQPLRSLIASKAITGTSGRAEASLEAKWLFPTPFAPVMMIFSNPNPLAPVLPEQIAEMATGANGRYPRNLSPAGSKGGSASTFALCARPRINTSTASPGFASPSFRNPRARDLLTE